MAQSSFFVSFDRAWSMQKKDEAETENEQNSSCSRQRAGVPRQKKDRGLDGPGERVL
jgi:hypothetical protein